MKLDWCCSFRGCRSLSITTCTSSWLLILGSILRIRNTLKAVSPNFYYIWIIWLHFPTCRDTADFLQAGVCNVSWEIYTFDWKCQIVSKLSKVKHPFEFLAPDVRMILVLLWDETRPWSLVWEPVPDCRCNCANNQTNRTNLITCVAYSDLLMNTWPLIRQLVVLALFFKNLKLV